MKNQTEKVLKHLKRGRSLTALQALSLYGIGRLAPRIHELRDDGWNIVTDRKSVKKADGTKTWVASYRLLHPSNIRVR